MCGDSKVPRRRLAYEGRQEIAWMRGWGREIVRVIDCFSSPARAASGQ
jgi:hypothetical protein